MTNKQRLLSFWLDDQGGGKAIVRTDAGDKATSEEYMFNSLDELPPDIAEAIRRNGQQSAQLIPLGK